MPRPLPLAALLALGLALACSTAVNPATGRREVVMMSPEDELRIDEEAEREIESTVGLVRDPALNAYVSEVGAALARHSPRADVDYEFQIIEADEPNAFALPGGHIYVSRGLLLLANSEAELAHVLGHEIAHVAARHAANRDAHLKTLGLATLLGNILSGGAEEVSKAERSAGHPIARYLREQERQADLLGQEIAAKGGIEPGGMARFLTALDSYTKLSQGFSMPQTYFATHPATRERIADAATRAQIESLKKGGSEPGGGRASEEARAAYLDRIEGMAVSRPASEGIFVDHRFLHADLGFSLRFPHGWKASNEAARVIAIAPKRDGVVLLELQSEGNDPIEAAREFARKEKLSLQRGMPVRVGDLPAFRAETGLATPFGPLNAEITWIAHGGRIYRLIGGLRAGKLRTHQGVFRKFAQSFRPLTPEEAASIREARLRSVRALPGETLAQLSERSGNTWDLTATAVFNDLFVRDVLRAGQRIKIAVEEPYRPDPQPLPPAPADDVANGS